MCSVVPAFVSFSQLQFPYFNFLIYRENFSISQKDALWISVTMVLLHRKGLIMLFLIITSTTHINSSNSDCIVYNWLYCILLVFFSAWKSSYKVDYQLWKAKPWFILIYTFSFKSLKSLRMILRAHYVFFLSCYLVSFILAILSVLLIILNSSSVCPKSIWADL